MEIHYKEFYNENANIEVKLEEHITNGLKRIDFFLQMVEKSHPDELNQVTQTIGAKLTKAVEIPSLPSIKYDILKKYPDLKVDVINFIVNQMEIPTSSSINELNKVTINVKNYLRSYLFLGYTLVVSLMEIMSKEEAIQFYQAYADRTTIETRDSTKYFNQLAEIHELTLDFQKKFQSHNFINFKISLGKIGTKTLKCKWYEVMKELDDPEVSYALCCHSDFEATKNMNPNFVLTREGTLIQGYECCDFCYHDTRIIDEVTHPKREFWDNLEPGNPI
jgi:hypothetical protein